MDPILTPKFHDVDRRGGKGRWEEGGEKGKSEAAVVWWMLKSFSSSPDVGIHPTHTPPLYNTIHYPQPFSTGGSGSGYCTIFNCTRPTWLHSCRIQACWNTGYIHYSKLFKAACRA